MFFLLVLLDGDIKKYLQGIWTECVPLKYLILMPDIQEAKCFEFTVKILPPRFISVYTP